MKANFRDRNVFKVVGTEEMRIEVRIEWDLAKMCVGGWISVKYEKKVNSDLKV